MPPAVVTRVIFNVTCHEKVAWVNVKMLTYKRKVKLKALDEHKKKDKKMLAYIYIYILLTFIIYVKPIQNFLGKQFNVALSFCIFYVFHNLNIFLLLTHAVLFLHI